MRSPEQLELGFGGTDIVSVGRPGVSPGIETNMESPDKMSASPTAETAVLQSRARQLLRIHGAARIAAEVQIKWNSRLRSCAGRADYRRKIISLNPRLRNHPDEIERTLLHELAHFLAQFRAGRRCISPHGREWRCACADLGIAGEKRCHNLPFPILHRIRRFLYECPNCARDFPRVRRVRRAIACLACCRLHSRGEFDPRFRLRLIGG
jgi:SprT protein